MRWIGRLLTKQEARAYLAAPASRHVLRVPEESANYWVAVYNAGNHQPMVAGRDYVMAAVAADNSAVALGGECSEA